MRVLLFISLLLLFTSSYGQSKYRKDFDDYWKIVNDNFAYFDTQKTDWNKVKAIYQPMADTITSRNNFIRFLEAVNNELYNGHISLNTNLPSSNRLIPTGADLWVKYQQGHFIITALRSGFQAQLCGLKTGMLITAYNEIPIDSAVLTFLPKSITIYDNRMYEYAANMLLAGTHDTKRKITARFNDTEKMYFPDSVINKTELAYTTIIEHNQLPSNIGYIKINNSLGNIDLINAFDSALNSLWNTKGLILDIRETPSGGNTTVARAVMSRFIEKEMPYQKHSLPSEENQYGVKQSWIELVSPRGKIYKKPLVVLVNRWTGSMGEGIAIGFDGMKRAQIVGDAMAGLLGAIYSFTLPETNIGFSIPVEKLFHVNGTPREDFRPKYLESDSEKQMAAAMALLNNKQTNDR
jgi:C-terminal processing protease CtpA/Prc